MPLPSKGGSCWVVTQCTAGSCLQATEAGISQQRLCSCQQKPWQHLEWLCTTLVLGTLVLGLDGLLSRSEAPPQKSSTNRIAQKP